MNTTRPTLPATRREFIKSATGGIGLLAFSQVAPAFLAQSLRANQPTAEAGRSILVLIQLGGGNDGLNTLIPYQDDRYYRLRPNLGIKKRDSLPIHDQLALHPSCSALANLFREGQLAILQNVGYPNPNRSHFRSMEIWETASDSREYLSTGWLGRYFDNCCPGPAEPDPVAVNIGNEMPDAFLCETGRNLFSYAGGRGAPSRGSKELLAALRAQKSQQDHGHGDFLRHTLMNTLVTEERITDRIRDYRPLATYPATDLAQNLKQVAALIASGQRTRVYYVSHSGFDTHANQLQRHAALLQELSDSMAAFQADLAAHRLDDQVLTATFSEFGRRPNENGSGGTDHGTAAPLFVMGSKLQPGLHGQAPSLDLGPNQDLPFSTDFRRANATLIDHWLGGDSALALGAKHESLPFLHPT